MGDADGVRAAAARIVGAFGAHDTVAYFGGFAPEATFVFHAHPEVLTSRNAYEQVWAGWEAEGFRVHACRSSNARVDLVGTDTAVFVHDVDTDVETAGARETVAERETIVFRRADGGWLAVHEHLSPRTPA